MHGDGPRGRDGPDGGAGDGPLALALARLLRAGDGAGRARAAPGSTELTAELAELESVSARLSAELPSSPPAAAPERTVSRLQAGLGVASVERLQAWLAEPAAVPAARIRRRAAEVLDQVRRSPPPSPARAAAVELWAWLTGAEADRRLLLAGAGGDRRLARRLSDELRLLQTVQAGVRRGQPDVIPSTRTRRAGCRRGSRSSRPPRPTWPGSCAGLLPR